MDFFLPSDIARLVLGYLKENGFKQTHTSFLKECPHLQEYYKMLMNGRELQTTILGFSLILILEEWGRLKQENSINNSHSLQTTGIDGRRKSSISPLMRRREGQQSPSKQVLGTSPRSTPHVHFADSQNKTHQRGEDNPVLKGLLVNLGNQGSNVRILPLTPEKNSSSSNTPVQLYSPIRRTPGQVISARDGDKNDRSPTDCRSSQTKKEAGVHDGKGDRQEVPEAGTVDTPRTHNVNNDRHVEAGQTEKSALTVIAKSTELHAILHKTPTKFAVPSSAAAAPSSSHLVTPVKLFQGAVTMETSTMHTRSPRRKKPKTPKKRTSDTGNLSGSEDVPVPVFKKILEDNRLHEKLAETCNSYLESINHSKDKERSISPHTHHEEVDTNPSSRSLEEILDMDTNFVGDLISDNIDMTDPAFKSLFKLFGKEKETFYEELRKEKLKTDDMAKEVEELEKSIQQEIEAYNSPLHSIEAASVASPDSVHHMELLPSLTAANHLFGACGSLQSVASCTDNNTAGFLHQAEDNHYSSPMHSKTRHRGSSESMPCSPASVFTQPFSPNDCSQVLSPATPYNQSFNHPSSPACDSGMANGNHHGAMTNGFMSPNSHGLSTPRSVPSGVSHSQVHQSTPVRHKHPQTLMEHYIPNCSPLAKSDMTADSPVMVQKNAPFTPKSTYTPHSRTNICTPSGTNRHLFSPPAQIVPGSPAPHQPNGVNIETNSTNGVHQFSGDSCNGAQSSGSVSVHEQSYGYNYDMNTVQMGLPGQSGFSSVAGSNPCLTIANSIGCISLPPEEPAQSTKLTKGGKAKKGKGKKKMAKGVEHGSSTFSTLKNLLNKPSHGAGVLTSGATLSMPDLLIPPGSPLTAHLANTDVQNQNIILLSPGGTSYKIPVLDCQDELGLRAADISGAETINVWESDLNTSTQYSILPENQVTQCLVNSIEQGNSSEVINEVQRKKAEKSKGSKAKKQGSKKKKSKKADKSASKMSQSGSENVEDNTDSDAIYVASPLMLIKKPFVRNLDFGVDENRFRKIMPRPAAPEGGTVIIVNNSSPDDAAAHCTSPSLFLPQNSVTTTIACTNPPTDNTPTQPGNECLHSPKEGISDNCETVHETARQPSSDKELTNCEEIQAYVAHSESKNVSSSNTNESVIGPAGDAGDNVSFDVASEESPSVESYKDWKGRMKPKVGGVHLANLKKQVQTSTPLHVSDSGIDSDLTRQTMVDLTINTDTPKNASKPIDKREEKQRQISNMFKKSSQRTAYVKTSNSNLSRSSEDTNKSGTKSKSEKRSNSEATKQACVRKTPAKKVVKIVKDSDKSTDDSSLDISKGKRRSVRQAVQCLTDSDDTGNNSCDLLSPSSSKARRQSKDSVKSTKNSGSLNSSSNKGNRKSPAKVIETKPASTKSKGKSKQKKSNLLKVKFTGHSGSKDKHKDTKQSKIVSSKQEVIELEMEEDSSSDDDLPLCQLRGKLHAASPNKSIPTPSPNKSIQAASPNKSIQTSSPNKSAQTASPKKAIQAASPKKSTQATSPNKSIPSTPKRLTGNLCDEFASPSKEILLEKVGLTPTKTLPFLAFKSPQRANPLDLLAEWQGSPVSKGKASGLVTRNRVSNVDKGMKSPAPKTRSSAKKRTPGRKLFKDVNKKSENVEKKTNNVCSGEESPLKSPVASRKQSPKRTLFDVSTKENANKENEIIEQTSEGSEKNEAAEVPATNVSEDELQQALQSIEVDNFGSRFDDEDYDNGYEEHYTAIKLQADNYLETFQPEDCVEEARPDNNGDTTGVYKTEKVNSVNANNGTTIDENQIPVGSDGDCLRTPVTEAPIYETNGQTLDMPMITEVVNSETNIQKNVFDYDFQAPVNGKLVGHTSDKERKEKRKKRHKEKKHKRQSLETTEAISSTSGVTEVENGHSMGESGCEESHSCSQGHHHHGHKHHHHHHHSSKHKKKKSKKRHREEDGDESKERHKSKRKRVEASQALETMDIDQALSQLYSSSIAAT